ncbi:MAG: hypothetical protein ACR2QA_08740 [Solirubrobacteraceae bacterium]
MAVRGGAEAFAAWSGYIKNLASPHAAAVASAARIAAVERDQEATEKEQQAARAKAQFQRETALAQARIEAEVQQAQARLAQAAPLEDAKAAQDVISEPTALAQRAAALTERRLESEVRRPADAEAYRQRTLAEASRDTAKLNTEADAYKQRTMAEAARDTTKFNTEAEASCRTALAEAQARRHASRAGGRIREGNRRIPSHHPQPLAGGQRRRDRSRGPGAVDLRRPS